MISSNGDSDVEQSFRNVLVKRDRTSFATYAHYVRGLFVDPRHVRVAVVDEVLRSPYIKLPLLPNLEALALRYPETLDAYGRPSFSETTLANIAFARLFLSDRVTELSVYNIPPRSSLDKAGSYRLSSLTDDIINCAPKVKSLTLTSDESPNELETRRFDHILATLFVGLRNLEQVRLCTSFFSSRAIHALSLSTRLAVVSAVGLVLHAWGQGSQITLCPSADAYYGRATPDNAWPQLTQYTAVTGAKQLSTMLQEQTFPSRRITSLVALLTASFAHAKDHSLNHVQHPTKANCHGETEIFIPNSSVLLLLRTISLNCYSLAKLYLDFNVPFPLEDDNRCDGRPFDAHDLIVLKDMQNLEELTIRDHRSLCISDNALLSIIGGLSRLTTLYLFHIPYWTPKVHLDEEASDAFMSYSPPRTPSTIQTISKILGVLPVLTHLGIYVDFSTMSPEDMHFDSHGAHKSLLEILDLGHSPPPPPSTPAGFLDIFLDENNAVEYGGGGLYDWGSLRNEMFRHIQNEQEAWEDFI